MQPVNPVRFMHKYAAQVKPDLPLRVEGLACQTKFYISKLNETKLVGKFTFPLVKTMKLG